MLLWVCHSYVRHVALLKITKPVIRVDNVKYFILKFIDYTIRHLVLVLRDIPLFDKVCLFVTRIILNLIFLFGLVFILQAHCHLVSRTGKQKFLSLELNNLHSFDYKDCKTVSENYNNELFIYFYNSWVGKYFRPHFLTR